VIFNSNPNIALNYFHLIIKKNKNKKLFPHLFLVSQKQKIEWERLKSYRKGASPPCFLLQLRLTPAGLPLFQKLSVPPPIPTPYGIIFSVPTLNTSTLSSHTLLPLSTSLPKSLSILPSLIALSSSTMVKRYYSS